MDTYRGNRMTPIKKNDLDVAETFTEKYGSLIWEKERMVSVDQADSNMAPAKSNYTLGPFHLLKTPDTKSVITAMIISIPKMPRNSSKEIDDYEGKAMRLHHEELQKEKQKRQIMLEGVRKLVTPLNEQFLMSPDMSSTIATNKENKDDAVQVSDLRFSGLLLKKGSNYKMEGIVDASSGKPYEGGFNPSPHCVRKYILKGVPIIRPGTKVFHEDGTKEFDDRGKFSISFSIETFWMVRPPALETRTEITSTIMKDFKKKKVKKVLSESSDDDRGKPSFHDSSDEDVLKKKTMSKKVDSGSDQRAQEEDQVQSSTRASVNGSFANLKKHIKKIYTLLEDIQEVVNRSELDAKEFRQQVGKTLDLCSAIPNIDGTQNKDDEEETTQDDVVEETNEHEDVEEAAEQSSDTF
ncbi:hypothetical protein BDK51DRAFT_30190 [Blyttiomyces helicus]|uniref:Uncharacterized protein n=1 Tax=Blyttiomyces helicus TaxID=388810 RepID=A0A4P9WMV1_9FUNG|nr:hypothetical protein BDK51DRAFT_30190 [Blyttiomyces helicus]|eukprot:RKO92076.1 hypothetical protein BDK51DRAFT_30190 [Blyttiomyces helicus]